MLNTKRTSVMSQRGWVELGVVLLSALALLVLVSSGPAVGQPPGASIIASNLVGRGPFPILIVVINAALTGPSTCDNSLAISPSGPSVLFQGQQITPALLQIPPGFPQGMTTVVCRVPISTGVSLPFSLTITVCGGPGQQLCPYTLTLNRTSVTCEVPGQEITLQVTVTNGATSTLIFSITGGNPWLTLADISPQPPATLAPGDQKQFSLRFTCKAAGTFSAPFVQLHSEPKGVPPPATIEQAIDVDGDGIINDSEIMAAVAYWTTGQPVPNTGGQTISDAEILKLASLWVTGAALSPPQSLTVTLADNGRTIPLHTGDRFLLDLGSDFNWTVTVADPSIVSRVIGVLVIRGAQGVYEARQPGQTELTAVGDPPCRQAQPPCAAPSRLFEIQIVVQP